MDKRKALGNAAARTTRGVLEYLEKRAGFCSFFFAESGMCNGMRIKHLFLSGVFCYDEQVKDRIGKTIEKITGEKLSGKPQER